MPGRILIVEDNASIRALLRVVLEDAGHACIEVADGPAALPAAREEQPDVVLLDVDLPGEDGFAILARFQADAELRHVPVLMVTGGSDSAFVTRALSGGAHDYVRKPFDVAELGARVDAALRVKTASDALAEANAHLAAAALSDSLTELPNRRHLGEVLGRHIESAHRTAQPFSVAIVDVDRFKAINDGYGHAVGDEILRAVAERLGARARASDLVGRWGGEEFLVLAPGTDVGGGGVLAEDLRVSLEERPFETSVGEVAITASFGVAQLHARERADTLLARADAALYAAKANGRNAVRLAEEDAAPDGRITDQAPRSDVRSVS